MKKLLAILGSLGLVGMAGTTVIACGNQTIEESNNQKLVNETVTFESITNNEQIQEIENMQFESFEELKEKLDTIKIPGVESLEAQVAERPTDVKVTAKVADKNIQTRSNNDIVFILENVIMPHITVESIKEKIQMNIKNCQNIVEFKEKLSKLQIEGVASLTIGQMKNNLTSISVKVQPESGYTIDTNNFVVEESLIKISEEPKDLDIILNIADIEMIIQNKEFENLITIDQINEKLHSLFISNKIEGIKALVATDILDNGTDVLVTVELDDGYRIDKNTFIIKDASILVHLNNLKIAIKGAEAIKQESKTEEV